MVNVIPLAAATVAYTQRMESFVPNLVQAVISHGYLAIFLIMAVEEAGVPLPIPGDGVLLFAGYLVVRGNLDFGRVLLDVDISVLLGASILYCLAHRGGRPLLLRYGRYLRIDAKRFDQLAHLFQRFGPLSPGISRLIPGMRIYTSALAGLAQVDYRRFALNVLWACTVWALVFLLVGRFAGERWREYSHVSEQLGLRVVVVALVILVALWCIAHGRHWLKRGHSPEMDG